MDLHSKMTMYITSTMTSPVTTKTAKTSKWLRLQCQFALITCQYSRAFYNRANTVIQQGFIQLLERLYFFLLPFQVLPINTLEFHCEHLQCVAFFPLCTSSQLKITRHTLRKKIGVSLCVCVQNQLQCYTRKAPQHLRT